MQNDTSQYVVNIIPLQNIQSNVSGFDDITTLQTNVTNLQSMVNFNEKRIYTNFINSYTTGNTIQFEAPVQLLDSNITTTSFFSPDISVSSIVVSGSGIFGGSVSATGFITLSDVLAKKNILPIQGSVLKGICSLQPYLYEYKENEKEGQLEIGLLAQEIEEVFPEAVVMSAKGTRYVKYDAIVALLVGAVKELKEEINVLKGNKC